MNGVGKIHRRGAARQRQNFSFGREGVDLFGIQVHLQRGHELRRLAHLAGPLDQLAHPDDSLIVAFGNARAVFVSPVRRHALFGDAMHLLGANLHFKRLPGMNHGGVQRLIKIGPRHGDVILKPAGHGTPNLVDHAERGVAVAH